MAEEKKQPAKVDRKDYVYCIDCQGYVLRTLLRVRPASFFNDEPEGKECPVGHLVVEEAPANG